MVGNLNCAWIPHRAHGRVRLPTQLLLLTAGRLDFNQLLTIGDYDHLLRQKDDTPRQKGYNTGMTKTFLAMCLFLGLSLASVRPALAQRAPLTPPSPIVATDSSGVATTSAETATAAASVNDRIQQQQANDITETRGKSQDALTAFLEENPPAPLTWYNFLQHAIRRSVSQGLSTNIVVLIILFPIITSIIAASRHLIGLQGFGVYIPAVLAVAFVSTGLGTGVLMFTIVLLATTFFRTVIKRLRLQYLPRTALMLWGVSLSILSLLILTSIYGFYSFLTLNIFPLLIIMLLTENFVETQLTSSRSQTIQLTLETLFIAVICSVVIDNGSVQKAVLLRPELTFACVALFNLIVGRYSGLRLLEYIRFRSLLEG